MIEVSEGKKQKALFELKRLPLANSLTETQLDELAIYSAQCAIVLNLSMDEVAYALNQLFVGTLPTIKGGFIHG